MTTLPLPRLAALLTAHAKGFYATEAATQLLIGHETWLHRSDFLNACVWAATDDDRDGPVTGFEDVDITHAWIDWAAIPAFAETAPCSGSEGRVLRLVAELSGYDTATPLDELLSGLDDHNSALVVDSIAHALHVGHSGPEEFHAIRRVDGEPMESETGIDWYHLENAVDGADFLASGGYVSDNEDHGPFEFEVVRMVVHPVARFIYPTPDDSGEGDQ